MCTRNTFTCVNTCGCGASTHGGRFERTHGARERVIVSSTYQKFAHVRLSHAPEVQQRNPCMLPIFSLRVGREQQTRCRVLHLFASPEHTRLLQTHDTTTQHNDTHNTTTHSHTQRHTANTIQPQHNNNHSTTTATATHRTRHSTEAKRREEEMKEMNRDRDENRYR